MKLEEGDVILVRMRVTKCIPNADNTNEKGWTQDSWGFTCVEVLNDDVTKVTKTWIHPDSIVQKLDPTDDAVASDIEYDDEEE
jgi:hypothetical protein